MLEPSLLPISSRSSVPLSESVSLLFQQATQARQAKACEVAADDDQQVLAQVPSHTDIRYLLGLIRAEQQQTEVALACLHQSIILQHHHFIFYCNQTPVYRCLQLQGHQHATSPHRVARKLTWHWWNLFGNKSSASSHFALPLYPLFKSAPVDGGASSTE